MFIKTQGLCRNIFTACRRRRPRRFFLNSPYILQNLRHYIINWYTWSFLYLDYLLICSLSIFLTYFCIYHFVQFLVMYFLRFSIAVLELCCFSCFPLTLRCTFVVSAHVTELMFHSAHVEARTLLQHGILTTLNFLQAVGNSVALSNLTFAAFFVARKESLSLRWSHILPFIVSRKWKYVIRSSHLKLAVFELSRQHVDFSHTKREIVRRVVHLEV